MSSTRPPSRLLLDKIDEYKRIVSEKRNVGRDYDRMKVLTGQLHAVEDELKRIVESLHKLPSDPQLLVKLQRPYPVLIRAIPKASQDQIVNLLRESSGFFQIHDRPDKNEILRRVLQDATHLEFSFSDVKAIVQDPEIQADVVALLGETIDRLNLTDLRDVYDRASRGPEAFQVSLRLFFHPSEEGATLTPDELDTFMTEEITSWNGEQLNPRYLEYATDILFDERIDNVEYSAGKLKFIYFPEDLSSVAEVREHLLDNSLEDGVLEGMPGNSAIIPTEDGEEYGYIDYRKANNITVKKMAQ